MTDSDMTSDRIDVLCRKKSRMRNSRRNMRKMMEKRVSWNFPSTQSSKGLARGAFPPPSFWIKDVLWQWLRGNWIQMKCRRRLLRKVKNSSEKSCQEASDHIRDNVWQIATRFSCENIRNTLPFGEYTRTWKCEFSANNGLKKENVGITNASRSFLHSPPEFLRNLRNGRSQLN